MVSPNTTLNVGSLPVMMTSFNRPETFARVLEVVSKVGCQNVYFASDGPRNREDLEKIQECLAMFTTKFPNVSSEKILIRKTNIGCRRAMYENVKWFFAKVDMGVVLEDDCLPNEDFFSYMISSLQAFKSDSKVFMVSGFNPSPFKSDFCYRKSIYPLVWGWGSWSDRVNNYIVDFNDYKEVVSAGSQLSLRNRWPWYAKLKWNLIMKHAGNAKLDTWDYSLTAAAWRQFQYTIVPKTTFIENIGFGPKATHTRKKIPSWAMQKPSTSFEPWKICENISYGQEESLMDQNLEISVFGLSTVGLIKHILGLWKRSLKIGVSSKVSKIQKVKRK